MRRAALLTLFAACAHSHAGADPMLRIYLARHGQTDWNRQKRLQGQTDVPLDETGRAQAVALAAKLAGIGIDRVYSSALTRSKSTAAAVAADATPLVDLNEQALGKFEGAWLDGRDPAVEAEYGRRSSDPNDTLDGGESVEQHFARVRRALESIRAAHAEGQILIVGHGGTNALILRALLGLDAAAADGIHQSNDELFAVDLRPGKPPHLWKHIPKDRLGEL